MPFVYVHGVNTRADGAYAREQQLRDAFLSEIVAPAAGINPSHPVFSPYWGDEGIKFWKGLDVVPDGRGVESLGKADELPPSLGIAIANNRISPRDPIERIIQQSPDVAIDLLFDSAVKYAESQTDFQELARGYRAAQVRLAAGTSREWLANSRADTWAGDVFRALRPPPDGIEQFGASKLRRLLDEGASRLMLKIPDVISGAAITLARRPLTRKIATFAGDAFKYLAERGDGKNPGPIATAVLKELKAARDLATRENDPLVVISHSFGGEIMYDILTHYAEGSDFIVDVWVTVGSQVGLFEEMSLFLASRERTAGTLTGTEAIPAPGRVKRWINIIDSNDVLGFTVLPVFTAAVPETVHDFVYDTGFPIAGAHSGYFVWPSFYNRLAQRIRQPLSSTASTTD